MCVYIAPFIYAACHSKLVLKGEYKHCDWFSFVLFNAKSIFIHIDSSILMNPFSLSKQFKYQNSSISNNSI